MKSVKTIISKIHEDLKSTFHNLLLEKKLEPFKKYAIGNPLEKQELSLYIRVADFTKSLETLVFQIITQLYQVKEETMHGYLDALNEYLCDNFSPHEFGYLDSDYSIDIIDNSRTFTTDVIWTITLSDLLDDCD